MTWKVPGYVVEELLGFGGSGEVWRGKLTQTGQPVALKRITVENAAQLQAARAEAALLSTLDHPHLVHLHELVTSVDAVVLVLDLAAGGSLADLLRQRGRLTPGEVITALAPIGAALAYAHSEGVVHGDVSAGNVLFTDVGLPLLADLGVARIIGDDRPIRSTPAYIDPAVANGHPPGAPSDVFSLAAVAVHALSGQSLWSAGSTAEMIAQAASGEVGDLSARVGNIPNVMLEVLKRALALEPHLRSTAAEFALDLRHSGIPTPVELGAGRPRTEPGTAPRRGSVGRIAAPSPRLSFERPAFERPAIDGADGGAAALGAGEREVADQDPHGLEHGQLTHGVRVGPRGPAAVPGRRRRLSALSFDRSRWPSAVSPQVDAVVDAGIWSRKRKLGIALVAAGVVVVVAAIGTMLAASNGGARIAATALSSTHSSALPSAEKAETEPSMDAAHAETVLAGLDEVRQTAFSQDNATLLAQVYLPGSLLTQDMASLARAVPAGCSLVGMHTTYSGLHLAPGPVDRVTVVVTASLSPSTLMCGGVNSGQAAGDGPTSLHIELVSAGSGYLIAAQQVSQ